SRAGQLLTSELVEQARREAVADWITTGLTPGQILALQNATVQITDLNSEGAFGFAGSRLIQLDDDALGFGWHVGSGPVPTGAVDLGTVMRHELGHILGYGDLDPATAGDSIMSGTILPGERRSVHQTISDYSDAGDSDVHQFATVPQTEPYRAVTMFPVTDLEPGVNPSSIETRRERGSVESGKTDRGAMSRVVPASRSSDSVPIFADDADDSVAETGLLDELFEGELGHLLG
ncbi:MAG: hypothetical protein ACK5MO_14670, partial [Planctomyces sp.]